MVTREELYALVWAEPMIKVAESYGVSGSYMARVCGYLKVPRPERGYWAKLEFGKPVSQPPLPEILPGDPTAWSSEQGLNLAPPPPRPRAPRLARSQPANVAVRGVNALVASGRSHYAHVRPGDEGRYLRPFKRLMLDVTASKSGLDGALRFASDLYNALETAGHRVVIAPHGAQFRRESLSHQEVPTERRDYEYSSLWWPERPTVVYVDSIAVGISIIEMTEEVLMRYVRGQYVRDADYKQPKSPRYQDHTWTTTKQLPSGRLRVQLYAPYRNVTWKQEFSETPKSSLTDDIPAIVRAIEEAAIAMVGRLEDAARREEEWRRQMREEEKRRREEEDRRLIAKSKSESREQLGEVIAAWTKATAIESFFRGVEARVEGVRDERAALVRERLDQARSFVGTHDPLDFFLSWKTPIERYVPLSMRDGGAVSSEDDSDADDQPDY